MLSLNLLCLLSLFSFFDLALSGCHSRLPLTLPIGDFSSRDSDVSRRGVSLKVGTPPQSIAAIINFVEDITSIRDFNKDDSDTWSESHESGLFSHADGTTWGKDILHLNPGIAVDQFPLGSSSSEPTSPSFVGLGRNSTILDILVQQSTIASRTWSLFWGWQGADKSQQLDGSLTFGGYDKAKTAGPGLGNEFSDDIDCPTSLVIEVGDILLGGQEEAESLKSDSSPIRMCIRPDSPFTTLPKDIYKRLKASLPNHDLASTGIYEGGLTFEDENMQIPDRFSGNMTFKLSDGTSINIPSHRLIAPNKYSDANGQQTHADDVLLISESDASKLPILGQSFLSASYLHVDNELQQFTIWPAKTTNEIDLIPVDHRPYSSECIDSQIRLLSSRSTSEAEDKDQEEPPPPARPVLEGGGVPGIALGVVVGAVFLFLTGFFIYQFLAQRRLRRRSRNLFSN